MRFSIYSEMQLWPGKSPERLYAEVEEQIVHADRLGYDAYAIVEHFFFPRFSISPDPLALFAQVAPRTQRIRFRTMLHCLPFHNPTVLASRDRRGRDPHRRALRVRRRPRPRLGPAEGRRPHPRRRASSTTSPSRSSSRRSRTSASPTPAASTRSTTRTSRRRRPRADRGSSSAARATRPTSSPAGAAGPSPCRRCCPTRRCATSSTSTARSCAEHGNDARHRLDPRLLHGRGPRRRAARRRGRDAPVPRGQRLAADRARARPRSWPPPATASTPRGSWRQLAATPYDEMIDGDIVWVGTPDDVAERVAAIDRRLRGADRGRDHRQPRRLRPLAGDQDPGDLRRRGRAALPRRRRGRWRTRRAAAATPA